MESFSALTVAASPDDRSARLFLASDDTAGASDRTLLFEFAIPLEPMPKAITPSTPPLSVTGLLLLAAMLICATLAVFGTCMLCRRCGSPQGLVQRVLRQFTSVPLISPRRFKRMLDGNATGEPPRAARTPTLEVVAAIDACRNTPNDGPTGSIA